MRMLMKVQIPTEAGNRAVKEGTIAKIVRSTLDALHPEAAYFATMDGQRTMIVVFDLKATSDIPGIAEPLFMAANATVEFAPCMNADDLRLGLSTLGQHG